MLGPVVSLSSPVLVSVTSGPSNYDILKGLSINKDEKLIIYFNRFIMHRRSSSELEITFKLDGIQVWDRLVNEMRIIRPSRTLRVPENGKAHDMPTVFGPAPLIDISKCSSLYLPKAMKDKGGLMIPLLQREALCIAITDHPFGRPSHSQECLLAMKLYAGGVNVISGLNSTESQIQTQDYYVLPLQKRIDGFGGAGNQQVKQFVAMTLNSGYSAEAQITGKEIGGLQIQIAPRLKHFVTFHQVGTGTSNEMELTLLETPSNLNIPLGKTIRMAPWKDAIPLNPWVWRTPTEENEQIDRWTHWTNAGCQKHDLDWGSGCEMCFGFEAPNPRDARPALLSDILVNADLEPQGAFVVSAVQPISITLELRSGMVIASAAEGE